MVVILLLTIIDENLVLGRGSIEKASIDKGLTSSSSLRGASGYLFWFANIVTSVNADLAIRQKNEKQMQMPSQHGNCLTLKKGTYLKPRACIGNWVKIKNWKRTKRNKGSKSSSESELSNGSARKYNSAGRERDPRKKRELKRCR
ncbi:hypothetical protein CTI12_AA466570 [Artemisia annua]|uniref:Uncharacterized protein n=1 Tax=Artemisia annua TaxID=35608 RepID=A0A2U1KWS9_ARTAN|nr:hypothetical protein CTI12_AA466570 [Artemisia annua]